LTSPTDRKFVIQFDRLDDNYNQYQDVEQYFQAIISLFKVVYFINQTFRQKQINNSKIIVYIRSDIFNELSSRDAESARWDDYRFLINWAILNRDDWDNPLLLQMINKRIESSLSNHITFNNLFDDVDLKNSKGKKLDVFKYIIEKTFHRPRDIIQFCKYIQEEVNDTNKLYFRTIKNAEKKYSFWLVKKEISNEINPILRNVEPVFELLKLLGARSFSLSDFHSRYRSVKDIKMESEKLAMFLYDVGIFQNVEIIKSYPRQVRIRSIIRNAGKFDRNMKIRIHEGVWQGLNA